MVTKLIQQEGNEIIGGNLNQQAPCLVNGGGGSTDDCWRASAAVGGELRPVGDLRRREDALGVGASADVAGGGARRPGRARCRGPNTRVPQKVEPMTTERKKLLDA